MDKSKLVMRKNSSLYWLFSEIPYPDTLRLHGRFSLTSQVLFFIISALPNCPSFSLCLYYVVRFSNYSNPSHITSPWTNPCIAFSCSAKILLRFRSFWQIGQTCLFIYSTFRQKVNVFRCKGACYLPHMYAIKLTIFLHRPTCIAILFTSDIFGHHFSSVSFSRSGSEDAHYSF